MGGANYIVRCPASSECQGTILRQTFRCSSCGRMGDMADADFRRMVEEVRVSTKATRRIHRLIAELGL